MIWVRILVICLSLSLSHSIYENIWIQFDWKLHTSYTHTRTLQIHTFKEPLRCFKDECFVMRFITFLIVYLMFTMLNCFLFLFSIYRLTLSYEIPSSYRFSIPIYLCIQTWHFLLFSRLNFVFCFLNRYVTINTDSSKNLTLLNFFQPLWFKYLCGKTPDGSTTSTNTHID